MTAALTVAPSTDPPAPPTCGDGSGRHGRHPAPLATMLAVIARIASHAGGVQTLTITEPGQRIAVMVGDGAAWVRWSDALFPSADAAVTATVAPGASHYGLRSVEGTLHGWSVGVHLARNPR